MRTQDDRRRIAPDVLRRVRPLTALDNWHWLVALAIDYALIATAVYLMLGVSWWLYPVSLVIVGSTQRAFANLLHESSHGILASNKKINFIAGTVLSGYWIAHLLVAYRNSHVAAHHRYYAKPHGDPDVAFHREVGLYDTAEGNWAFFVKNIVLVLLGFRAPAYLRYLWRDRIWFRDWDVTLPMPVSARTERLIFLGFWVVVAAGLTATGLWGAFLLFWVVPFFTTFAVIGWLAEMSEHFPLPDSEADKLLLTRNRYGWAIERFLFGRHGDSYHLVHHVMPTIPTWNLGRANRILRDDPIYRQWDDAWGGIFTRNRRGQETLLSYVAQYRRAHAERGAEGAAAFARRLVFGNEAATEAVDRAS
jgi:fatty acid desaturase